MADISDGLQLSDERLADEDLKLVAEHGAGPIERALAIVKLAKRRGKEDELREAIGEASDPEGTKKVSEHSI